MRTFSGFERVENRKCLFSALKSLLICTTILFNAMFSKIIDVCLVDKDDSFGPTGSVGSHKLRSCFIPVRKNFGAQGSTRYLQTQKGSCEQS